MKVFISWSGERSQILAQSLRDWLPLVLHYTQPWLSEADITAGDRWAQVVAKELETSSFGILCVTPENLSSPWVLFEAGALAKSMQGSKVIPVLFNLEFSVISGPLAQFQAKKFDRSGLTDVIHSINQSADQPIPEDRTRQLFSALWPELEKQIEAVPHLLQTAKHMRPQHEILEELVAGVRAFDSRMRDLEAVVAEQSPRAKRRRNRLLHPMVFEDLSRLASEDGDDPIALLMFAGLLRDDFPWLYEVAVETYRELRTGDHKAAHRAIERFHRTVRNLTRGPFWDELSISKEGHMMMMELPMMLDHMLHKMLSKQRPVLDERASLKTSKPEN